MIQLNRSSLLTALTAVFFITVGYAQAAKPDNSLTPGVLCSESDPDFQGYRYNPPIAYCGRNINTDEKLQVAQAYGNIPQSEWSNYEFDHLIPLAAGGSNNIGNLWPQPIVEARVKDILEDQIYHALVAGTLTQAQGVQQIHDWIDTHY